MKRMVNLSFSINRRSITNFSQINIIFKNKDNTINQVQCKIGQNILEVAHANNIDLEGACEASLACSTCHVILQKKIYDTLPAASPEEEDLLDLAYGLTQTSRLGCQVKITEQFKNATITLPKATRNFYVDGHKPKPH